MKYFIAKIIMRLGLWCMTRFYDYIDIYAPNKKKVTAITFSNSEKYIEKIQSIQ